MKRQGNKNVFTIAGSFQWPMPAGAQVEEQADVYDLVVMAQRCDLRHIMRVGLPHDASDFEQEWAMQQLPRQLASRFRWKCWLGQSPWRFR